MHQSELFIGLDPETKKLFRYFIDSNPIGSLFLNDKMEVIYINECLIGYFEGNVEIAQKYFGNMFSCVHTVGSNAACGSLEQCRHCDIRNSVERAVNEQRKIKNVQINQPFFIKGKERYKWFDMTVSPMTIKDKQYIWVSLIDLTDLMQYKIEFEMNAVTTEDDIAINKDRFNEIVMENLQKNLQKNYSVILLTLKSLKALEDNFGSLWRNNYIQSFWNFINQCLDKDDEICRYGVDQFLIFSTRSTEMRLKLFLEKLDQYQYEYLNTTHDIIYRAVTVTLGEPVDENKFYINYFKMIARLEAQDENSVAFAVL